MNIEKWIEEKRMHSGITYSGNDVYAINVEDLRELRKTHAIVPREPSNNMIDAGFIATERCDRVAIDPEAACYKAMIKAAEDE